MLERNEAKYMNDFITLAKCGNYLTACDQLYLSRSTLAKHIRDLEAAVEHKLFAQSGHKLILTEFGKFYLDYAKWFVALDNQYKKAKAAFDEEAASEVRIAVSENMNCDHMVNMLWDHFIGKYPGHHLSTIEYQASLLSPEDLFAMGYELVFWFTNTVSESKYGCYPWADGALVALLPLSHPLAERDSVRLQELSSEPFILPPVESAMHQMVLQLCQDAGFSPQVNFTIHGISNLVELVSCNVGISIAANNEVPEKIFSDSVAIVPLDPSPAVYLNIYYQKDQALSKPAQTFFSYAKQLHLEHSMDIPFYGPEVGVENAFFE